MNKEQKQGLNDPCPDCEGSNTTTLNLEGIHQRRDHSCGCRDWSYTSQKRVWYRLKWCNYHYTERLEAIRQEDALESVLGGAQ